ncbi:hypothetical protein [Petrotoga sp. 9PWA.NaAc.5.4]|uniref:hypothetical protein n=1 Tax=Petrotoga sp. 9PWA.NaAc.5.4 TaxID=1434328 RepID=UPI0011B72F02|nr:hypothetical protein [Petrotoga sp. 9PWA.NaAc.5.4]
MQYFSKSPKEWEEYDEKKRKTKEKKYGTRKKITKWTSYIIILLSIATLFFIFFGPRFSRFDLPYNVVIKGINLNLQAEEEYHYPDIVDVKITMQNTNNTSANITLENFSFLILNTDTSEIVYSFVFTESINTVVQSYQTILVFDLLREKELKGLKNGNYEIRSSFILNNENINLRKSFKYNQDLVLNIYPKEMFFLSNEFPVFDILVSNRTDSLISKELNGSYTVKTRNDEVFTSEFSFGTLSLNSLESFAYTITINSLFSPNIYSILFEFDSLDKNYLLTLPVFERIDESGENLSLIVYSISSSDRGGPLYFEAHLKNDKRTPRGILISSMNFKLFFENNLIFNYENTDNFRVYLSELGTTKIFNINDIRNIVLDIAGNYEAQFSVKIGNKIFSQSKKIQVY